MPERPEYFACPIGVFLWQRYRALHPNAPEIPPDSPDLAPELRDAGEYWVHTNACLDCNEV